MARGRTPPPPDDLDRLYQLPLGEFTSARRDLARQAGAGGAAIRKLQKPSLPAWAVNQLYWQRRETWDRLVAAAARTRAAHGKRLSGKGGDVEAAEAEHRAAVREAADEIRDLLRAAGEVASAATQSSVVETLQALPGPEPAGRLTRPLKPRGLEALAGLVPASRSVLRSVKLAAESGPEAASPGRSPQAATGREARAAKRAAELARRQAARLDARIREAKIAERRAVAELARARQALDRHERERAHLTEQLQFLERRLRQSAAEVRTREARASESAGRRVALEDERRALDSGV
jgi:hypothetical protein